MTDTSIFQNATRDSMRVVAVIVAYQTDTVRLDAILRALVSQCSFVVADNSENSTRSMAIERCVVAHHGQYLNMGGNRGIGAAQNAAIGLAWRGGADHVLLLDDDSVPSVKLIEALASCVSLRDDGRTVFCARAVDDSGNDISNACGRDGDLILCREMMSSGSLISREIFESVGPFDEGLFIDGVDFDWGWRARQLGYRLYIVREASIVHRLGEGEIGGIRVPSPIRHYYQFRNVLHLMRRRSTPWGWRLSQAMKLPTKLLLIAALMPRRGQRLRYAFAGIRDAFRGRSGKYSVPAAWNVCK